MRHSKGIVEHVIAKVRRSIAAQSDAKAVPCEVEQGYRMAEQSIATVRHSKARRRCIAKAM